MLSSIRLPIFIFTLIFTLTMSFAFAGSVGAVIVKGDPGDPRCAAVANCPYVLDDDAFVDEVVAVVGTVTGNPDLETAITDTDLGTSINGWSPGSALVVGFTDNAVVNGPGPDIVIFEFLAPSGYGITIGGVTQTVFGVRVGSIDGTRQNAAELDLDDFGFAEGEIVTSLTLFNPFAGTARISGVAALNSAEPPLVKGDPGDPKCAAVANCPYVFDADAFVDRVDAIVGNVVGRPDVETVITDTDLGTAISILSNSAIVLSFTDNIAVNGPGTDIVIFEWLAPTSYGVTIGEVTQTFLYGTPVGTIDGKRQNAVELDLTDFGYGPGETVSTLTIFRVLLGTPRVSGVAALNSIPVADLGDPLISFGRQAAQPDIEEFGGTPVTINDMLNVATGVVEFDVMTQLGLAGDIDAFHRLPNGNVLFSTEPYVFAVPDVGTIRPGDVIEYDPNTGSFALLFATENFVGLGNVNALSVLPNGNLILSNKGPAELPGIGAFQDGDVVEWDGADGLLFLAEEEIFTFGANNAVDALHLDGDTLVISPGTAGIGEIGSNGLPYGNDESDLFQLDLPTGAAVLRVLDGENLWDSGATRQTDAAYFSGP